MNQPKSAYLIASAILPEGHASLAAYGQAAQPIFKAYGAQVLAVGTSSQQVNVMEGLWSNPDVRVSLVKFPSMAQLTDCLNSDGYLAIKHLRTDIITSNFSVAVESV